MRLIDAVALKERLKRSSRYFDLKFDIDEAPTIDAVPVVRCKDCKHYRDSIGWCDEHSYFRDSDGDPCGPDESPDWRMFSRDDFCSDGVRRAVDGEAGKAAL